jgi:hypothetical protein
MKIFNENQISNLSLQKTDINKRIYELRSGDEIYASLIIDEANSECEITTAKNTYKITKNGIWRPYLQFDSANKQTSIRFNMSPGIANAIIEGQLFQFKNINFWKNHWAWVNGNNHLLIKYNPIIAGSTKGEIFISDDFKHQQNLETLCCVGCYLLIAFDIDEELNQNK